MLSIAAPSCRGSIGVMSAVEEKTQSELLNDLFRTLGHGRAKAPLRGKAGKPDMKAFAERIAVRLKKQYGDRVTADSAEWMSL